MQLFVSAEKDEVQCKHIVLVEKAEVNETLIGLLKMFSKHRFIKITKD